MITRITFTIGTDWSIYKAERNAYKFTVYNCTNLTISTFRSVYKAEKQRRLLYTVVFNKINTECDS